MVHAVLRVKFKYFYNHNDIYLGWSKIRERKGCGRFPKSKREKRERTRENKKGKTKYSLIIGSNNKKNN